MHYKGAYIHINQVEYSRQTYNHQIEKMYGLGVDEKVIKMLEG